jgi:hypothetical protein
MSASREEIVQEAARMGMFLRSTEVSTIATALAWNERTGSWDYALVPTGASKSPTVKVYERMLGRALAQQDDKRALVCEWCGRTVPVAEGHWVRASQGDVWRCDDCDEWRRRIADQAGAPKEYLEGIEPGLTEGALQGACAAYEQKARFWRDALTEVADLALRTERTEPGGTEAEARKVKVQTGKLIPLTRSEHDEKTSSETGKHIPQSEPEPTDPPPTPATEAAPTTPYSPAAARTTRRFPESGFRFEEGFVFGDEPCLGRRTVSWPRELWWRLLDLVEPIWLVWRRWWERVRHPSRRVSGEEVAARWMGSVDVSDAGVWVHEPGREPRRLS